MTNILYFRRMFFEKPKINKIIVLLTLSDIFTWSIHLVLIAIVGIYLTERIDQNTVQVVGVGTAIYTASRGILQLVFGRISDMFKKDNDEIVMLSLGSLIMGATYLLYPLIKSPGFFYFLQFMFAVGTSMNLISWRKLFAQNLDKHSEGIEYGQYGFIMGISTALFSLIAGSVASLSMYYFNIVIISLGIITMSGSIFGILIFKIRKRKSNI